MTRGKLTIGIALVMAFLTVAAVPMAATADEGIMVNTSASAAHNSYIDADVTKTVHQASWDITEYEDNQGDLAELPAEVNETETNPYQITFSDIETSAYTEFPVNSGSEDANTWADDRNWTTGTTGTGSIAVSNVTTADGVDAVEFAATSMADTDMANATFDAYDITSDVDKRYVQIVADVDTLGNSNGGYVEIRIQDDDGDFVAATFDPDGNASKTGVLANGTGEGYVFQQQVGHLTVNSSEGDGTLDELNATKVVAYSDNANVDIVAFNLERTSPWTLGDHQVDTDGDDNNETETLTQINESGAVRLSSLDSMGTVFDAATLHGLTVPMQFHSGMYAQPSDYERFNATFDPASDYPSFDSIVNDNRRLALPSAYDLSYTNTELRVEQPVPSNRYRTVEYADAVGETDFQNVSGWTDATSSFSRQGDEVTLTTDVTEGEEMAIRYDYLVTADERADLEAGGDAGGGGPMADGGGGFFSTLWGRVAAAIGGILGFLGLRSRTG